MYQVTISYFLLIYFLLLTFFRRRHPFLSFSAFSSEDSGRKVGNEERIYVLRKFYTGKLETASHLESHVGFKVLPPSQSHHTPEDESPIPTTSSLASSNSV